MRVSPVRAMRILHDAGRRPVRILALDPGEMSGLASYTAGGSYAETEHTAFMLPFGEDWSYLAAHVWSYDMLVCEDFNLGSLTGKSTAGAKLTLQTIGVARYLAKEAGVPIRFQQPADAHGFDERWEKLKKLGWYTPGPDHARSASRHLLLALIELGQLDPALIL